MTMYEGLWKAKAADTESHPHTKPKADLPHTCAHCKAPIDVAHVVGKMTCVFIDLSLGQAKEAARLLLKALKENPKLDRAKKAKELIDAIGGVK